MPSQKLSYSYILRWFQMRPWPKKGQTLVTWPKKGQSFGHTFQRAIPCAWWWQGQILRLEGGESGDCSFLTSLSLSLHIGHFLTLSCQVGQRGWPHLPCLLTPSVLLLHLFTAGQVATDPIIKQLLCHIFKSRCSNNSWEPHLNCHISSWCTGATITVPSWHILTATSQAGATITVHMRGTTSAIRRAQLYCQVPVRPSVAVPHCHTANCHTATLPSANVTKCCYAGQTGSTLRWDCLLPRMIQEIFY